MQLEWIKLLNDINNNTTRTITLQTVEEYALGKAKVRVNSLNAFPDGTQYCHWSNA